MIADWILVWCLQTNGVNRCEQIHYLTNEACAKILELVQGQRTGGFGVCVHK